MQFPGMSFLQSSVETWDRGLAVASGVMVAPSFGGSQALAQPGGSSWGQAGEGQTGSLFLNPSGHYSCQGETDGS